ncbi:glycosyltransferase [Hyphomicrobium sp.]|uniref:glycosyltransferase n=1 Tax=Hyphomicrobium sp. TaxID=82 RepID=UPI00356A189E
MVPRRQRYAPSAFDQLRASGADIAHSHGIWKHSSRVVAQWAMATRRPYVVSPHGMLDTWALKRSVLKKKIASQLYENDHLRRAACLHALCDSEAETIRKLGFDNPICVIPNGIALPSIDDSRTPPWWKVIPEEERVMLFLGRLHPKKNLSTLIDAWPSHWENRGWHLAIAGWDQGGHEADLRAHVKKRRLDHVVHFLGPLFGREKDAALRRADAFVLPSLSEGLPMAVLEAWSYGLPVLQTDACNLPEGFHRNAAMRISPSPNAMANEIRDVMAMPAEALAEMGRNGRRIAEQNFSWNGVTTQMLAVYAWLLDGGRRPECVRLSDRRSSHAA